MRPALRSLPRLAVLPAACGLLLAGCGNTVSKGKLEDSIKGESPQLSPASPISDVTCPKDIEGKAGKQETCVATLENGHRYEVSATVTGVSGGTAHFTYRAGRQIK